MKQFRIPLLVVLLVAAMLVPVSAGEKVTICHNPGPNEVEITIADNALAAHLAHGDKENGCASGPVLTCPYSAATFQVYGPYPVVVNFKLSDPSATYMFNFSSIPQASYTLSGDLFFGGQLDVNGYKWDVPVQGMAGTYPVVVQDPDAGGFDSFSFNSSCRVAP